MPEFLSPDVFTQEVQGKSGQVPTASTSTMGLAGFSPRGPEGKAYYCNSFPEFVAKFGGFSRKSLNAYIAAAYYQNGGNRIAFVRELHSDALFAQAQFPTTWNVRASGRGEWANLGEVSIKGNINFYDKETASFSKFDVAVELIDPTTGLLEFSESFELLNLTDENDPDYMPKVINDKSEDVYFAAVSGVGGIPTELRSVQFLGFDLGTGTGSENTFTGSVSGSAPLAEGSLKVKVGGVIVSADDGEGNFVAVQGGPSVSGSVDYASGNVAIFISPPPAGGAAVTLDGYKKPADMVTVILAGGADGSAVTSNDVVGSGVQAEGRGIYALDQIPDQMTLCLPDFAGDVTTDLAMISYAEGRKDVIVALQPPKGSTPQYAVNYRRNIVKSQSSYAAMYYPWIKVPDSLNKNRPLLVPPCGHIAGKYAYTDIQANVGKAPAGTTRGQLQYISGIERVLTKADMNILYPAQINPLRSDSVVGNVVWGNKTLQVVGDYTDVNIRRCFINLEKEQTTGLLDIVFEDIGNATFGLITARLDSYLEVKYLNNVIGSGVPDKTQAYKIICNETNNPQSIQESKRIVIDEYIKPNLAAEFIHLRIQRVFDASKV